MKLIGGPDVKIGAYLHCKKCLDEWNDLDNNDEITPQEYQKIEAGWTPKGLQIACVRHEINIIHIDFEGERIKANVRGMGYKDQHA